MKEKRHWKGVKGIMVMQDMAVTVSVTVRVRVRVTVTVTITVTSQEWLWLYCTVLYCTYIIVCEGSHRVNSALAEPDVYDICLIVHLPHH